MRLGYWLFQFSCRWLFIVYGRGRVFGLHHIPRTGPALLASNHQSFFDPAIVGLPLRRECHYMARDTLFRNRYFGALITSLNAFPIRRASGDIGAIKEALRRLKRGGLLLTFPEGTRTSDGSIARLQSGIVSIARRAKCPIVPTIVEGAYEIWPRDRKLPGVARLWVEYAEPIGVEDLARMGVDEATALLTERLRDLHNGLRRRIGRRPFDYDDPAGPREGAADAPTPRGQTALHAGG